MHDFRISDANNDTYYCLEWLLHKSYQKSYKGVPLLVKRNWGISFTGGLYPDHHKEFEDHFCQFLYILSECDIEPSVCTVRVNPQGSIYSVSDIVKGAQSFCNGFSDLSWALPVFAKWSNTRKWTNKFGSEFDLDRLFSQHLKRERSCGACFGTHWRMGLARGLLYGHESISKEMRIRVKERLSEAIRGIDEGHQDNLFQRHDAIFSSHLCAFPSYFVCAFLTNWVAITEAIITISANNTQIIFEILLGLSD